MLIAVCLAAEWTRRGKGPLPSHQNQLNTHHLKLRLDRHHDELRRERRALARSRESLHHHYRLLARHLRTHLGSISIRYLPTTRPTEQAAGKKILQEGARGGRAVEGALDCRRGKRAA